MTYITSFERFGYNRGKEDGLVEGQQLTILQLLAIRIGEVSEENRAMIESLSLEQLNALTRALLDFASADDLSGWLQQNQNT